MLKAGDMVFYADGTEPDSHTPNGCLLAVHIAGPEFPTEQACDTGSHAKIGMY